MKRSILALASGAFIYVSVDPPCGLTVLSNGNICKISDSLKKVSTTFSATLSDTPSFISFSISAIDFHHFNLSIFHFLHTAYEAHQPDSSAVHHYCDHPLEAVSDQSLLVPDYFPNQNELGTESLSSKSSHQSP